MLVPGLEYPRDARGRTLTVDAFARFRARCAFDPFTGCVLWTGGRTRGRGNTAEYGSFWFGRRRWFAHRWAGVFIHGLDLSGVQAGHCCPHGANSLCVQHIAAQTQAENLAELNGRLATRRVEQTNAERQFWLLVERGYEPAPPGPPPAPDFPFYEPPDWLAPIGTKQKEIEECPF